MVYTTLENTLDNKKWKPCARCVCELCFYSGANKCDLYNASYVGYILRHLHQRLVEHKNMSSSTGKHYKDKLSPVPKDLDKQFSVLKKCDKKFDCLLHEMLLIRKLKPSLNVHSDSIPAKLFSVTLCISYMLLVIQKVFCHFISNHFDLENSIKMTPKPRLFLYTLFFTCFSFS